MTSETAQFLGVSVNWFENNWTVLASNVLEAVIGARAWKLGYPWDFARGVTPCRFTRFCQQCLEHSYT